MDIGLDLQTAYREGYEQGKLDAFADLTGGRKDNYVPVVRCKDCKYFKKLREEHKDLYWDGVCYQWSTDYEHRPYTNFDDYCSYGERR